MSKEEVDEVAEICKEAGCWLILGEKAGQYKIN
jgi:phosphoribosylaminoimidazole (AIR) synthetase